MLVNVAHAALPLPAYAYSVTVVLDGTVTVPAGTTSTAARFQASVPLRLNVML